MQADDYSDRLRSCEAVLREHGMPVTVQRRVLLESLLETTSHPTAEELYERARNHLPALSRTTVYRVLDTLVELGLAFRVPHPTGAARFDGDTSPHHHAACTQCSRVFDVMDSMCESLPKPKGLPAGFQVESCSVLFTGICRDCQGTN